ncbi:hypothetical protein FSP39_014532 [Pinctada imbricata]|uniref:Uncharacterized protein n=1 Tax=Pinctada imbricata TaxID=66713 RepID=A0AA88XMD1_PINIB|nr:hypothetical protein FSP39_014532 [Pinctada imbricata]
MGDSKPTQHKEIICDDDMLALREYFSAAESNPIILRQFVWFCIAYHFVTRGSETHHQLTPSSFAFRDDGHGEYAVLVHETAQKNHQGGLLDKEENVGKSMYATGGILCPVKCLKLLIEKTDATASKLFNQYNSEAVQLPVSTEIWFTAKSLAKRSFANFMSDISNSAKTSQRYTNHCVRATANQTLNDANVEARHIMFLSDHANEGSLRSYNRTVSREQKKMLSSTLSKAFSGE